MRSGIILIVSIILSACVPNNNVYESVNVQFGGIKCIEYIHMDYRGLAEIDVQDVGPGDGVDLTLKAPLGGTNPEGQQKRCNEILEIGNELAKIKLLEAQSDLEAKQARNKDTIKQLEQLELDIQADY